VKKVREISVNGRRVDFWSTGINNLTIVEHTDENNKCFNQEIKKNIGFSLLAVFSIAVLVIVNYYVNGFMGHILINNPSPNFFNVIGFLFCFAFNIVQFVFLIYWLAHDFIQSFFGQIVKMFRYLSKSGRDKNYAALNRNDDLMLFIAHVYGKSSEQLIAEHINDFNNNDLVLFTKNIKEQLDLHKRIAKVERLIVEAKVDDLILEDLKNKEYELTNRYSTLTENIENFVNLAYDFKNKKVQQSANEEAIKHLAA